MSALLAVAGCEDVDPLATAESVENYRPRTLLEAVLLADDAAVREFLARGANVNQPELDGTTPLMRAIHGGAPHIAQLLIDAGADVSAANRYGVNSLYLAARARDAVSARALLEAGADPNTALPDGETALMTAARTGSAEIVALLLGYDDAWSPEVAASAPTTAATEAPRLPPALRADPNAKAGWHGQTALMWAAAGGHTDIVRMLLAAGANVDESSALLSEPSEPSEDAWLVASSESPVPKGQLTALHFAAREGRLDALEALLEGGANVNARDGEGQTPALLAATNGHLAAVRLLLEAGADPNIADAYGRTVLFVATSLNGIRPERRPEAVQRGSVSPVDIVRLALEKGANPDAALTTALPSSMARGAHPSPILNKGATPFLRAAMSADLEVMNLLLQAGANPLAATDERPAEIVDGELQPANGRTTALMAAAGLGWQESVTPSRENDAISALALLIAHGADVNAANQAGDTALHGAALRGSTAIIQFLVEHGANVHAKNAKGYTPLDIATGIPSEGIPYNEATARLLRELTQRS